MVEDEDGRKEKGEEIYWLKMEMEERRRERRSIG